MATSRRSVHARDAKEHSVLAQDAKEHSVLARGAKQDTGPMRPRPGARLAAWLAIVAMPGLSWWSWTTTWTLWSASRPAWTVDDAVLLACGAIACAVSAYLAVTGLLLILASVAGAGSHLTSAIGRVTPLAWRRIVTAAIGVTISASASPAFADASVGWVAADGSDVAPVVGVGWVSPSAAQADTEGELFATPATPSTAPVVLEKETFASEASTTATPPPTADPARYVVVAGDSLWDIASERLGEDASDEQINDAWHAIYANNEATIGSDPSLILPGQVLVIPAEATR